MTQILNPAQALPHRTDATIINGPWPTYTQFKGLPERERWTIYELAKAGRRYLEDKGFVMGESYGDFIKRVTAELEI
ncbi:hypothetical protein [Pseudomonas putida]|uniref:hypothetical protein n=1 Tax=Pseudomonas putida TaxID=303 RepID=UPI0018D75132|nr:hypothetical protein [Pseudomonas putida]MBH3417577.1 hypothetical protein [Pseudomonas putida]MDG9815386.1 hypothetical protein [Pseudomonas putida]